MTQEKPNYSDLSDEQVEAYERVRENIRNNEDSFVAGYAGTGKSFLLTALCNQLIEEDYTVAVVAPTNKAVNVVRKRGVRGPKTIHKWLYIPYMAVVKDKQGNPVKLPNGEKKKQLRFRHRADSDEGVEPFDVVLVDESSMIGGKLHTDMLRVKETEDVRFVFFGDPFQLPPVKDDEIFSTDAATYELTEIHRTEQDNPVLLLAEEVRKEPYQERYDHSKHFERSKLSSRAGIEFLHAAAHDDEYKIICWTNNMRRKVNRLVRAQRRWGEIEPQPGDKLICLENGETKDGKLFYNGMFCEMVEVHENRDLEFVATVRTESGDTLPEIRISAEAFIATYGGDTRSIKFPREATKFDFAYAITCHKAQGSEWSNIAVYDQRWLMAKMKLDLDNLRRWYYTAITRTRDNLIFFT